MVITKKTVVILIVSILMLIFSLSFLQEKNTRLRNKLDLVYNSYVTIESTSDVVHSAYLQGCVKARVEIIGKKKGSLEKCLRLAKANRKEYLTIVRTQI